MQGWTKLFPNNIYRCHYRDVVPRSRFYTLLCMPDFTLHNPHFTLQTLHSRFHTPRAAPCSSHSIYAAHSRTLIHTPAPHNTLHTSHFTLHTSHFTVHTAHSTLHVPDFTFPYSMLYALKAVHQTFHTFQSPCPTPHFVCIPQSTPYAAPSRLYIALLKFNTLHSTPATPHSLPLESP